ncbi:uncharacterized protein EV154DRAFT_550538 [Mucor mucedo]|uniref:uncharacterized protein n=1 Tax=Mucor mucedo TaxID=29922 RepID=UPI00221F8B0E|nr:uncharacterized protein EV154DRAFT_550538 [Mucor mucedo]KAI7892585.1 hypothetical protein EV154DRAFT_550538 [Mucor mucedo]
MPFVSAPSPEKVFRTSVSVMIITISLISQSAHYLATYDSSQRTLVRKRKFSLLFVTNRIDAMEHSIAAREITQNKLQRNSNCLQRALRPIVTPTHCGGFWHDEIKSQ